MQLRRPFFGEIPEPLRAALVRPANAADPTNAKNVDVKDGAQCLLISAYVIRVQIIKHKGGHITRELPIPGGNLSRT